MSAYYVMHKNIPVILLVNTASHDMKYYAYIPNIWREGEKFLCKMDISLVLRDIVSILLMSPMPTLIVWLLWHLLVLVFTDSDQNLWYKLYQIENFGLKLVSDGNLEILLDNADDGTIKINWSNTLSLQVSFRSLPVIMQLSLRPSPRQAMAKPYSFSP